VKFEYALALSILILLIGAVGADSLSSVIVVDGAAWVSSSVLDQGQTYTGRLFATDLAVLVRDLMIEKNRNLKTSTDVRSTGPVGVDEYSAQVPNQTEKREFCVFDITTREPVRKDQILYSGLMRNGRYISYRENSRDTSAVTMVNGTGLMVSRAISYDGNNLTEFGSTVGGEMNMTERILFGED